MIPHSRSGEPERLRLFASKAAALEHEHCGAQVRLKHRWQEDADDRLARLIAQLRMVVRDPGAPSGACPDDQRERRDRPTPRRIILREVPRNAPGAYASRRALSFTTASRLDEN